MDVYVCNKHLKGKSFHLQKPKKPPQREAKFFNLEREKGFEPSTLTMAR